MNIFIIIKIKYWYYINIFFCKNITFICNSSIFYSINNMVNCTTLYISLSDIGCILEMKIFPFIFLCINCIIKILFVNNIKLLFINFIFYYILFYIILFIIRYILISYIFFFFILIMEVDFNINKSNFKYNC